MRSRATLVTSGARCPPWSRPGEPVRMFARGITVRACLPVAAVVGCVLSGINEGVPVTTGRAGWRPGCRSGSTSWCRSWWPVTATSPPPACPAGVPAMARLAERPSIAGVLARWPGSARTGEVAIRAAPRRRRAARAPGALPGTPGWGSGRWCGPGPLDGGWLPRPRRIVHAALISPIWLNACGKLPSSLPVPASASSASSPTSLTHPAAASKTARACRVSPARARQQRSRSAMRTAGWASRSTA